MLNYLHKSIDRPTFVHRFGENAYLIVPVGIEKDTTSVS